MFVMLVALSIYLAAVIGCLILVSQLCECVIMLIQFSMSVALALAYYDLIFPLTIPAYNPQYATWLRIRRNYKSLHKIPTMSKILIKLTEPRSRKRSSKQASYNYNQL
jgi:hypothetical protein